MSWNNDFHETVAFFMTECGADAEITVSGEQVYVDGEYITTDTTIPVRVIPLDYIKKSDGLGVKDGTQIQTGDKQVFIQPKASLQDIDTAKTILKMDNKTWKFIAVKNLNTTLNDSVLFEVYVRH